MPVGLLRTMVLHLRADYTPEFHASFEWMRFDYHKTAF